VAVSDAKRRLATGAATLPRSGDRGADHRAVKDLVAEYEASGVVVGLPLSLSGEVGPAARAALDEAGELGAALGVEVVTHDERFTTVTATTALRAGGRRAKKQRAVVDQVAAAVMLQSWLETQKGAGER
jgi:putative Holliday junction resolvase